MGSSKSTMEQCQNAANDLATEYVNSNNFLAQLNDTNKDYYITQLDNMGVDNAEEVIKKEENAEKAASMSVIASAIKTAISYNSPLLIWW